MLGESCLQEQFLLDTFLSTVLDYFLSYLLTLVTHLSDLFLILLPPNGEIALLSLL